MPARCQFIRLRVTILATFITAIVGVADIFADAVSGIVQDRGGNPVAGVSVSVISATDEWMVETDDAGVFHFDDVPTKAAALVLEHQGFRFHGRPLRSSEQPITLRLIRVTESPGKPLIGKDWAIPSDQRKRLIHQVFDPHLEQILAGDEDRDKLQVLKVLGQLDPHRALELCEEIGTFKQGNMRAAARGELMQQLAAEEPESAIEIAEGFDNAYMRAYGFVHTAQVAREMSQPDRIALLSRATADAKSVKNPGARIALMGLVGKALLDVGEKASAEKLLRETETIAAKVAGAAWAGFARGSFAETLAQIDLDAALPMVTELSDQDTMNRHLGNISHALARPDPENAERVLNMIEQPSGSRAVIHARDEYAVRVCYRMATSDLARAKRIADACHEKAHQAYAHGMIAHAIASDRETATETLRHAYELLKEGVRDPKVVKIHASQIAGCLLRTAEQIDPELVAEMVWRSIALRTPHDDSPQYAAWSDQQMSQLAAWISRYDRDTARFVLDEWHSGDERPHGRNQYTFALTLVDPQRAVEFAESNDSDETRSAIRLTVAKTLLAEGDTRIRIPNREAGLWPIDADGNDW